MTTDLMQLVDDYAEARARYGSPHNTQTAQARQRVADYIGVDIAANMATAAAQGFRDGQAAEHPDTARLRFVAATIDEPWDDETIAAQERELPDGVKTLEDLRKLVDIRKATRGTAP